MKNTMVELVQELEQFRKEFNEDHPNYFGPYLDFLNETIEEARAGEYHDYKNKKYVCGKVEAYSRLSALNMIDLAERIKNGEFDEKADESDKEEMRKNLPPAAWPVLGL